MAEDILELISVYGALSRKQIYKYLQKTEYATESIVNSLIKNGRIVSDGKYLKSDIETKIEENIIKCFDVVADFTDNIEFHYKSSFPLSICFFENGEEYAILYCKEGDEIGIKHALENMETAQNYRLMIVIDTRGQIKRIGLNAIYCINTEGEIKYYGEA